MRLKTDLTPSSECKTTHQYLNFLIFIAWFPKNLFSFASITMAGRINLFRSIHKYQRMMGIYSTQTHQRAPFNYRSWIILGCFAHFCIPTALFFVLRATSFEDYAACFYAITTSFSCSSHYMMQMRHIKNYETLTEKYEEFIKQSMWRI